MVLGGLAPRSPSLEYISGKTRFGSVSQSSIKGAVGLELRWGCRSGRAMPPTVNTVPLGKGQPPSPQNLFIEDVADGELSVWPGLLYSAGRTCSENTLTPSLAVWNSEVWDSRLTATPLLASLIGNIITDVWCVTYSTASYAATRLVRHIAGGCLQVDIVIFMTTRQNFKNKSRCLVHAPFCPLILHFSDSTFHSQSARQTVIL